MSQRDPESRRDLNCYYCATCTGPVAIVNTCGVHNLDAQGVFRCDRCLNPDLDINHQPSIDCIEFMEYKYKCSDCGQLTPWVGIYTGTEYTCVVCIQRECKSASEWHKFLRNIVYENKAKLANWFRHRKLADEIKDLKDTVKELKDTVHTLKEALLYQTGSHIVNELKRDFESKQTSVEKKQKIEPGSLEEDEE